MSLLVAVRKGAMNTIARHPTLSRCDTESMHVHMHGLDVTTGGKAFLVPCVTTVM